MTEAELIKAVRAGIGTTAKMKEVLDADIKRIYPWVLARIGEKITIRTLRYITSVANQRAYSVPTAVLRVIKVFSWSSYEDNYLSVTEMGATHRPGVFDRDERYHHPSTWTIDTMKKLRGLPKIRFEFDPINRELKIDPYPTEAGKKYWYLSVDKSKWTLSALPEDMEELLVTGCVWKAAEQVAMKRSELGGVMREGGRVTYPASELWTIAKDKRTEFKDDLTTKAMIYNR